MLLFYFDRMRNRWGYIQPQVKRLQKEETIIAPSNNDRCIVIGEFYSMMIVPLFVVIFHSLGSRKNTLSPVRQSGYTVLSGNIVDTTHFSYSTSRSAQRSRDIHLKTQDLCQYELDKQKAYTFSHAVRYG